MQIKIPCVLMRGGTSRGPFFLASDLPADIPTRDKVLLAGMGSPHILQVDGIGGGHPLTSKVAIVERSSDPRADVDYLFAQVLVEKAIVDTSPNCGNMLIGVGPFAIESGLVKATPGETRVRILNRNAGTLVEAYVQTPGGCVEYDGDVAIDGVSGTAAPVKLNFLDAMGRKTGKLFPTGKTRETIDGITVSLIDFAMPMMILAADAVGITGYESAETLDAMKPLFDKIEPMRREAGRRMGLGDVSEMVIPKVGLLAAPTTGNITSRYFVPDRCHKAHPVTGSLCIGLASLIPGTVAADIAKPSPISILTIEHPAGQISVDIDLDESTVLSSAPTVRRAAIIRTTRRLFEGMLLVPSQSWPQRVA